MRKLDARQVSTRFRRQHGVAARSELRGLGVTAGMEAVRVARGEWERPTARVVRLAGSPRSPEQGLMIALLEAGPAAVASHESAAWLWGLLPAPARHAVTMSHVASARKGPFTLHRLRGGPPTVVTRRGFPVTNPLRTLVDLAGVVSSDQLDTAVDRAVASRLVTVEGIAAELGRVSRRGRKGAGATRSALHRRGMTEGPHPSVLEARLHRLLRAGGITPIRVEVVAGPAGEYRIDTLLDPLVAVEVDGHVHHSTPEQKAYDERRRAEIRMSGVFLLVYDWRAVHHEGRRVLAECHQALARYGSRAAGRLAN
jgi:very-short-patch-repair endonuclease